MTKVAEKAMIENEEDFDTMSNEQKIKALRKTLLDRFSWMTMDNVKKVIAAAYEYGPKIWDFYKGLRAGSNNEEMKQEPKTYVSTDVTPAITSM